MTRNGPEGDKSGRRKDRLSLASPEGGCIAIPGLESLFEIVCARMLAAVATFEVTRALLDLRKTLDLRLM